jgi:hypothetical protein
VISRAVIKKQRGRRWLTALATLAVLSGTLLFGGTALAVHEQTFQLDGDVDSSTTTNVGGSTQTVDWDAIFDNGAANADAQPENPLPPDYSSAGFKHDFVTSGTGGFITSDTSTFATGSKDTLPISGWQCNFDNNVNSKIDVMNAYTVSYDAGGDEVVYFALERNTNTGDANVAFWFLQSEVGCSSTGGSADFGGGHTDGDVLVVSEFSNGGDVSTINVYEWVGDDATGHLNTTPIGAGKDCRDPLLLPGDSACAAANKVPITTPWPTANFKDKVGHNLRTSEFFEGGINLTALDLGGKCFSTFVADTRSSTSLTATLFDFAAVPLGECTSGITTTPQGDDGAAIPATIGTAARVIVRDHAEITVTGADGPFGGTVQFSLCGPDVVLGENCSTGGVPIGAPVTVVGNAGSASLNSPEATLTSAGNYCWRAEYSGDAGVGVPPSSDPTLSVADGGTTSECFSIGPEQPSLTTLAGDDVILGADITDTATLSGTAMTPGDDGEVGSPTINATAGSQDPAGGTITWSVVGPDDCDASGLTVVGSPATVSGDDDYVVSATPTLIGEYTFIAEYSGDSPNTLGAGPSLCSDADEKVIVGGTASLATNQDWLPNDTATLTGDTNLTGTLTFQLYTGDNCGATSGAAVAGQNYVVPVADAASGSTFSTDNTTSFLEADSGSYSWLVTYADDNLSSPGPSCETTTITIDDTP